MTNCTELWVDKQDLRRTQVVESDLPTPADGEILVAIDKFGLTANNVSYASAGDMLGYWQFYPAEDPWGKVPVWGCADVIQSNCDEVPVGDRLWGFFPMASHALLRPGNVGADKFTDFNEHRRELPGLYNSYRRTLAEPEAVQAFETERCLLFPLFATSFVLADYLIYNDCFGAQQILIGSASSKTGFGLAKMLRDNPEVTAKIVGLTSAGNQAFVDSLQCCDEIVVYGEETQIDAALPAAYVDMSGDGPLTETLHRHLGDNMRASVMVGATHWESQGRAEDLPGAQPEFFFAPAHIATREKEWGSGVPMMRAMEASVAVAAAIADHMNVSWLYGPEDLQAHWLQMLDNQLPANRGLMVSLLADG